MISETKACVATLAGVDIYRRFDDDLVEARHREDTCVFSIDGKVASGPGDAEWARKAIRLVEMNDGVVEKWPSSDPRKNPKNLECLYLPRGEYNVYHDIDRAKAINERTIKVWFVNGDVGLFDAGTMFDGNTDYSEIIESGRIGEFVNRTLMLEWDEWLEVTGTQLWLYSRECRTEKTAMPRVTYFGETDIYVNMDEREDPHVLIILPDKKRCNMYIDDGEMRDGGELLRGKKRRKIKKWVLKNKDTLLRMYKGEEPVRMLDPIV